MTVFQGEAASAGIAAGKAFYLSRGAEKPAFRAVSDRAAELARFAAARDEAAAQLRALQRETAERIGPEEAEIFEIDAMMLEDEDYCACVAEVVESRGAAAEYAVAAAAESFAAQLAASGNDYLAARAADVRDISDRVIGILSGAGRSRPVWEGPAVLLAEDLLPSETVQLDRTRLLGIATSKGSLGSHTAILARSMGIPAVIGLGPGLDASCSGREVVLDGYGGTLCVDPDAETAARASARAAADAAERGSLKELRGKENRTRGGRTIDVFANIGGIADLAAVAENDAGGIGLLRSEFLYLEKDRCPTEDELFEAYRTVAQAMGGKKVVIRTLDIGADKRVPYFDLPAEENPALGLRALRLCLARPEVFKTQLRAILRASAFGTVSIMFPMLSAVCELDAAEALLAQARAELDARGKAYDGDLETGLMIETPAAALISDELAARVDFFSIGTNDLTQYTLAADRQNPGLGAYLNGRHPAVLKLIETTVRNGHERGIWVGICGELGADLGLTETFLRMGVDELSVNPSAILGLRRKIRETE